MLVEGRVANSLLRAAESGKMLIKNHHTEQVTNVINVGRIRKALKTKQKMSGAPNGERIPQTKEKRSIKQPAAKKYQDALGDCALFDGIAYGNIISTVL